MGMHVIPIPTEVVSHSLPFPFPILCFIPIPMGFLWDSRSHWESHSHAHLYSICHTLHRVRKCFGTEARRLSCGGNFYPVHVLLRRRIRACRFGHSRSIDVSVGKGFQNLGTLVPYSLWLWPTITRPFPLWVTVQNLIAVGRMVRTYVRRYAEKTLRVKPFKVTQSHRSWHDSIGCRWFAVSGPTTSPCCNISGIYGAFVRKLRFSLYTCVSK